jgi:hypothetical protein
VTDRTGWRFTVVLQATEAEADQAADAIARALCPDEFHDGPCRTPWALIRSRLDDMDDPDEAARLRDLLTDE